MYNPFVCPHCGAIKRSACDMEDDLDGVCPWEESGQMEDDLAFATDLEDDD